MPLATACMRAVFRKERQGKLNPKKNGLLPDLWLVHGRNGTYDCSMGYLDISILTLRYPRVLQVLKCLEEQLAGKFDDLFTF